MGILSGVRLGERFFSIQTEVANHPRDQVVTVVFLDGQVMQKCVTPAAPDTVGMERQIEEQHRAVEKELKDKAAAPARLFAVENGDIVSVCNAQRSCFPIFPAILVRLSLNGGIVRGRAMPNGYLSR